MEIFKIVLDLKYRNKTSSNIIVKIMQYIVTIKEVILTRENISRMESFLSIFESYQFVIELLSVFVGLWPLTVVGVDRSPLLFVPTLRCC